MSRCQGVEVSRCRGVEVSRCPGVQVSRYTSVLLASSLIRDNCADFAVDAKLIASLPPLRNAWLPARVLLRPPSPPVPHKVAAHTKRRADTRRGAAAAAAVDRPLGNGALRSYARNNAVEICLDDDAANNHLCQGRVHRLKVEDEVELADVLKQTVERLDVDLNKVDKG